MQYARRKYPIDEVEDVLKLQNVDKPVVRLLKRATSCDLALVTECVHGVSHKITMKDLCPLPLLFKAAPPLMVYSFSNTLPS